MLLVSAVSLRSTALPRALSYLGCVISVAGILTVVPPLGELGIIFGLGQIFWFIWLEIILLRVRPQFGAEQ